VDAEGVWVRRFYNCHFCQVPTQPGRPKMTRRMGNQERDLHAGGMVFIPAYTWVNMKLVGSEPVSLVGIFSAPGFEDHLRCASVPAGEKPTPMALADWKECDMEGHVVYEGREETPEK
jgi:hypothetical protein